jgi:hypothetical protein
MADHTQDHYRGLILRDARFSAGNATILPTTAQAGPMVREPLVTSGEGFMDLEATGTSTAGKSFDIQAVKPGNAKGTDTGGRFAWRNQADAATSWRGWMPYSFITGASVFGVETATRISVAWPHAITTKEEYVHLVYSEMQATGSGTLSSLKVKTLNPYTEAWSIVQIGTGSTAGPCTIVELPSGRLLVLVNETSSGSITSWYSDDKGATWAPAQSHSDSTSEDYGIVVPNVGSIKAVIHFQAVYHAGYITLIREVVDTSTATHNHEIDHYVSEDFGASFKLIERFQPALATVTGSGTSVADVYDPRLVVDLTGGVLLIYSNRSSNTATSRQIYYTRKIAPFATFADHLEFGSRLAKEPDQVDTQGRFVACVDPEGFLCVPQQSFKDATNNKRGMAWLGRYDLTDPTALVTDGRTHTAGFYHMSDTAAADTQWELFSQVGSGIGASGWTQKTETINRSTVTHYKDRLLIITGSTSENEGGQGTTGRGSPMLVELGGYQSFDMAGGISTSTGSTGRNGFTYIPTDTPDSVAADVTNFSPLGTATNTAFDVDLTGLLIDTSPAGDHYFIFSETCSAGWARVRGRTVAGVVGGEITSQYASFGIGSPLGVELRFGRDRAQVWDTTPGYGSAVAISNLLTLDDEDRDWMISWDDSGSNPAAWVMYKKPADQVWTRVTMTSDLSTTPTSTGGWFGHRVTGSYSSTWNFVQFANTMRPDLRDWTEADYHPIRQYGRPFSVYPTYLDAGWQLESKGSAAFVDDKWAAETGYEFPISAAHPEIAGSPRIEWRSIDTTEVSIEWNLNSGATTRPLSPATGLHLNGINFKTANFEGWNGAAWVSIGAVNAATDYTGLSYALSGNVVAPRPSGTFSALRYVELEELAGSYAVFDPGGGSESIHKINHNSEGSFSAASGTVHVKPAELEVGGDVSAVAAAGTFEVWEDAATLIVYNHTAVYQKYRLRIPAQSTAEGYFKIGAVVCGPLLVFGTDYSWGRTVALESNQEITTGRSGDRIVEELGPLRRQVQFAWTEGWDARPTGGSSPIAFDHLSMNASTGLGVRNDPTIMAGALRRLRGAKEPTVFLPRLPDSGNQATKMITGRARQVYGRVVSPVTQQTILGDEGTNEVLTINQIVIDEEI